MTDYWPQEEGAVFDAESYILPCRPDGGISEMSSVKLGTTVAGRISVIVSDAIGDSVGIALKEATDVGVPERIPVLFYGVAKVTYNNGATAITAGKLVWNSITTTYGLVDVGGTFTWASALLGTFHILGMALQGCGATDEGLVLVGKVL